MLFHNNQNNNIRISLALCCAILIGLLVSKFTGYDNLFSYKKPISGVGHYSSGIELINKFLDNPEQGNNFLIAGKKYIRQSLVNLESKKFIQQISGDIQQLSELELYKETKDCLNDFITGFSLLDDIKTKFLTASNAIIKIESDIIQRVANLPTSNTKKCLELYIISLNESKKSLSLTFDNIIAMELLYQKSLSEYKQKGGGICLGIGEFVSSSLELQKLLDEVIKTTELVQKKLNTFSIQEYNSLCKYGGIQGVEELQKKSRSSKNHLDGFMVNLKKTNDIMDYIKTILPISGSGSLVNINNLK